MPKPTIEQIREKAISVADSYSANYGYSQPRPWWSWGLNAREDFWAIAQDEMDIPLAERIDLPDVE